MIVDKDGATFNPDEWEILVEEFSHTYRETLDEGYNLPEMCVARAYALFLAAVNYVANGDMINGVPNGNFSDAELTLWHYFVYSINIGKKLAGQTRILWLSRHDLTPDQMEGLKKIYGQDLTVDHWKDHIDTIDDILPSIEKADAVAAVLPMELLADLVKVCRTSGKDVLVAKAKWAPVPNPDGGEPKFAFIHDGWQRVGRLELELAPME